MLLASIWKHLEGDTDPLLHGYMRGLSNRNKFEQLDMYYLSNPFLTRKQIEHGLDFFMKIQRTYWGFRKFVHHWHFYRHRRCVNNNDFVGNELSSLSPRHKIKLLHDNKVYEFRLSDLLNIICRALTNSQNLRPRPKWPNNPYTAVPFRRAHLYAIYFELKETSIYVPCYFHLFFKCNFSIRQFRVDAFVPLKDHAIKNYLTDSSDETLLVEIVHMVYDSLDGRKIYTKDISPARTKTIVRTLRPYLETYLYGSTSSNKMKQLSRRHQAKLDLRTFFKNNPSFGRRIVKARRK